MRNDAFGFRGPGFTATADPGVFRIVVTGDSYTFGHGVHERDACPSLLGALLDRARPGSRHEIIDSGLPGAPVETVMKRLEQAIDAYDPAIFVYGVSLNDLEGQGYVMPEDEIRRREWIAWGARQPSILIQFLSFPPSRAAVPGRSG